MSVLDELDVVKEALTAILAVLEQNKEKLDRLLASGGEKELVEAETRMEPASNFKGSTRSNSKLPEVRIHSPGFEDYKSSGIGEVSQAEPKEEDAEAKDFYLGEKGFVALNEKEATDDPPIVWVHHDGKKFKACKYKCGNYVGWDNVAKKYLHYDSGFKLIGHDCPRYATPEVFKD